jgi:hypothetical protein
MKHRVVSAAAKKEDVTTESIVAAFGKLSFDEKVKAWVGLKTNMKEAIDLEGKKAEERIGFIKGAYENLYMQR